MIHGGGSFEFCPPASCLYTGAWWPCSAPSLCMAPVPRPHMLMSSHFRFAQCPSEAPKTRRQAEALQNNNLIEINPQSEGKVYTRCFCLEETLGGQVRGG